jgi:hypothetical protein
MSRVANLLSASLLFISGTLMAFHIARAQPDPRHLLRADDFFLDAAGPELKGNSSQPGMPSVSTAGSR